MTWRQPDKPWPAVSPHRRRYGWLRLYDNFAMHPKWRVVASLTMLPVHEVVAVAATLLCKANGARPRGSLAEFSPLECAAALDLPREHVECIYAAMEEIGWIDQGYLTTWDDRQPDKEDPTAKERQQRRRAKIKGQWSVTSPTCHAVTSVTERDVTPDKTRSKKAADDNGPVNWEDSAEKWLSGQGIGMVQHWGKMLKSQALKAVTRWRNEMRDDEALRNLINASAALAADGKFLNLVAEGVARHAQERAAGASLALGPVTVARNA